MHHSHFEQGVVKIREKNYKSLTQYEIDALQCLKPKTVRDVEFVLGDLSLIERALKMRKIQSASGSECMEAKFLVPASNLCGRLFSHTGHVLGNRRRRIILFANRDL